MQRIAILIAGAILVGLGSPTTVHAEVACPPSDAKPAYETSDRCRARAVDIFTEAKKWETLREGRRLCFKPDRQVWQWKCQGYTEAARCRGVRNNSKTRVAAVLRDNQVTWRCYAN